MFNLHPKLIDFDLKRLKILMDKFHNPQNNLNNVVHIAGTNGKGSTAAFLREILEAHNLSVNIYTCLLYTSPSPRDLSTSRMPSSA